MHLRRLKLRNYRNYSSAEVLLPRAPVIILGDNGAGKTNILEAIQYSVCGRSFRTSRESEMVRAGREFFRLEAEVDSADTVTRRAVAYEPGTGVRVDPGGGAQWLSPGLVLCFSPDDLQLIKGPPAVRRRFLDEAISRRLPAYHGLVQDYQQVLSQRNSFLKRARAGLLPLSDIKPWDRQLAQLALEIFRERREHCTALSPLLEVSYSEISGETAEAAVAYRSQLTVHAGSSDPEASLEAALAESWQRDMERLSTSIGAHRDDTGFVVAGKDLKPYGSQGEQRTAVLALLLAGRRLQQERGGQQPLVLLDDVMSELDPERRRRLMRELGAAGDGSAAGAVGQVVITAADSSLFSEEEMECSTVIEVRDGAVLSAGALPLA